MSARSSDKMSADLRAELKRFAAEEMRSELNSVFDRMQQVVLEEVRSALKETPVLRKLPTKDNLPRQSLMAVVNFQEERAAEAKRANSEIGGGWVSRLRSNLKVPLGDGIEGNEELDPPVSARLSYAPLLETDEGRRLTVIEKMEEQSLRSRLNRKSRKSMRNSVKHALPRHSVRPDQPAYNESSWSNRTGPQCVQDIVGHMYFDYIVCSVIVANAVVMGLEADWEVKHLSVEHPAIFSFLDIVFCFFFAIEIILRVIAYGPWFFSCKTHDWTWNYFDLIIVFLQIAEVLLMCAGVGLNPSLQVFKVFRVIRLCRCGRIFRLVRVFRLVPELHMLVVTCAGSMRSLFWTVMLLLFTTYTFGMYLTQVVAEHGITHPNAFDTDDNLLQYFGSIEQAVFKLYQTMFNGEDWNLLTEPLIRDVNPWLGVVFSMYVAFTVICLLNVITGVFLNSAMQTAEDDKNRRMIGEIKRLFMSADVDSSGNISMDEFEKYLDHPEMQIYLRSIDLLPDEAAELFFLLDKDGSGEVSLSEFTHGCMRLRGNTKAVDFAVFANSYEKNCSRQYKQIERVEAMLAQLMEAMSEEGLVEAGPAS